MTEWTARFISPDTEYAGAPLLRRDFTLDRGHGAITRAEFFLSAFGIAEAWINGHPTSADLFTPGWTSYEWRIRYARHDVTDILDPASPSTTIGIALGNGWYRGRLAWGEGATPYGDKLAAFAELHVTFADGHRQTIGTDQTWQSGPSASTANSLYDGQDIDARHHCPTWNHPGFPATGWTGVHALNLDLAILEPYLSPPVRRLQEIRPQEIRHSPSGKVIVDFGQNLVGWVRTAVHGPTGATLTLRHSEVLEHGELATVPLRSAQATDHFTLSGADDIFEPTFTFHGFRYLEVEGWPGGLGGIGPGALTAIVVGSDVPPIGSFETSNRLLNQLHRNIEWGMRGNFLAIPTDCPQRDERLGWTGDIAAFAPSAAFLADVEGFLRDWLRDLRLEQSHHDDIVPWVVPDALKRMPPAPDADDHEEFEPSPTALWGDAAVWVPWILWQAYGHREVLAESFESMATHVRQIRSALSPTGVWDTGFQFGDWLDPDGDPYRADDAKADKGVVATACAYRSARMVAESAQILGRTTEQVEFEDLADTIRAGFQARYVADRQITSDCTTVYALAIVFGLLTGDQADWAGQRLAHLVADGGFHISTGFAGTPFICDALTQTGHVDHAYRLLLQPECPSWLYPVIMGATTIWERWDSLRADGSLNHAELDSFNHYALGAVADWLHRVVGGLAPLEPGYRRILVAPRPGGDLTWVHTSLATPHGRASVRWEIAGDLMCVEVEVPERSEALLRLPGRADEALSSGCHRRVIPPAAAAEGKPIIA